MTGTGLPQPKGDQGPRRAGGAHSAVGPDRRCAANSQCGGGAAEVSITGSRLYTPAEAAMQLRVRESWLRRQAGERRIPCTFLGKHLRFSDTDLQAVIAAGTRPTARRHRRR